MEEESEEEALKGSLGRKSSRRTPTFASAVLPENQLAADNLLTFGLLRREHREILHEVAFRLGFRRRPIAPSSETPCRIPQVEASALLHSSPSVRIIEQDAADGNVTGYELLVLAQLVASRGCRQCFEIGTCDGRSALNMAANGAPDCRVYTLDLPPSRECKTELRIAPGDANFIPKESAGTRFLGTVYEAQITQLYGDSGRFDFSPYEGKMDFVFVDGSHSYDYVKSDTAVAMRLLKPEGGLILWHDYGSPHWKDLTRALNGMFQQDGELRGMRHIRDTTLVAFVRGRPAAEPSS